MAGEDFEGGEGNARKKFGSRRRPKEKHHDSVWGTLICTFEFQETNRKCPNLAKVCLPLLLGLDPSLTGLPDLNRA